MCPVAEALLSLIGVVTKRLAPAPQRLLLPDAFGEPIIQGQAFFDKVDLSLDTTEVNRAGLSIHMIYRLINLQHNEIELAA